MNNIISVGRSSVILMVETQRIHTGEKLAVINVDMKKKKKTVDTLADLGQALRQHQRLHFREESYECNECGDTLTRPVPENLLLKKERIKTRAIGMSLCIYFVMRSCWQIPVCTALVHTFLTWVLDQMVNVEESLFTFPLSKSSEVPHQLEKHWT